MFKIFALVKPGLLLLFAGLFIACSSTVFGQEEQRQVSVRLKFLHQTQFAGLYVAQQEGFYADEGLAVTLDPIDFEQQSAIDKVLAGENDFGITSSEQLVIARSEGKPVRAVAVIFRKSADVLLVQPDSGIKTPEDFLGRKVALGPGSSSILYVAITNRLGLDRSQIEEVVYTGFDLYECWEMAPVCPNYVTNGPIILKQQGQDFDLIWPSDYGITWYGDVLFTTDQMIADQPDIVERFVRATLHGWQKAIEEQELAVTATLVYDNELDEDFQREAMLASIPLIDTGEAPMGQMSSQVWQNILDIMLKQGLISAPVDVDALYTNEFVDKAW